VELQIAETTGSETTIHLPDETSENKHSVSSKKWDEWDDDQRIRFNAVFDAMSLSQWAFTHPEAAVVPDEHWRTTCWNAAWHAAMVTD